MASVSRITDQMQQMLPQWMKMAHDPTSTGAQFLNVFGLEFEDIETYLQETLSNQFIGKVNLGAIDITYKVPLTLGRVVDFDEIDRVIAVKNGEEVTVPVEDYLQRFYATPLDEHAAILDREENVLHIRPASSWIDANPTIPYDRVDINGTPHYHYYVHHIWNPLDEFGLLLGIYRQNYERNPAFQERILDVFRNPANATREGLINGISRDLGLSASDIKVDAFNDPAFFHSLLHEDGSPTEELVGYMENANSVLGFRWNDMSWGDAYWHYLDDEGLGFSYLPHVWDAPLSGWRSADIQSGIGDGDDLKVTPPKDTSNTRSFQAHLGVKGIEEEEEIVYPETDFAYKIVAEGEIMNDEYRPEPYQYTVVASERIRLHFVIRAYRQYTRETHLRFNDTDQMEWDEPNAPSLEVVTGEDVLHPEADPEVRVRLAMATTSKKATPQTNMVELEWEDTAGTAHTYTLDTQEALTRNNGEVEVDMRDAFVSDSGDIELGYGDFYQRTDTRGDWRRGTPQKNIEITSRGSLRLIPIEESEEA